jgi:hypothetical protein
MQLLFGGKSFLTFCASMFSNFARRYGTETRVHRPWVGLESFNLLLVVVLGELLVLLWSSYHFSKTSFPVLTQGYIFREHFLTLITFYWATPVVLVQACM